MTATESKDRILHDQMLYIERQRKEIAQLRREVAELEELIDLKNRYINEIYRTHFEMGGRAMNIELERITGNDRPLILCYCEIPNGEYYTIVRKQR